MKKVEAVEGQLDIYDILYPNSKPKKGGKRENEEHIARSKQSSIRADGTSER